MNFNSFSLNIFFKIFRRRQAQYPINTPLFATILKLVVNKMLLK